MGTQKEKEKDTVTFHLIKSPRFQSLRVDGAFGRISPNGLDLSFFVERVAIPQQITHEVDSDGALGKLVAAQGKAGMVRELQAGIVMDLKSAEILHKQLGEMLSNLDQKIENEHS